MLKKINRLTKKKEFDNIWQKGRSSFDKILGIKTLPNELAFPRFGILVGLKYSKKAVERNKLKRQLREIIRAELPGIKVGNDFIITVLPGAKQAEFEDLERSLATNLKRLRLL